MKNEMIFKNDIKIKLRTITRKDIEVYIKRSATIHDLKKK